MPGERGFGGPPPEDMSLKPRETSEHPPAGLPTVNRNEVITRFDRSSGPGGQNVNKTNSKAVLHWPLAAARGFSEEQKALIRTYAGNRLTKADEIMVYDQSSRSQSTNLERAYERLDELVRFALTPEKERRATQVPRSEKNARLTDKRRTSKKKSQRRVDEGEW